MFNIIYSFSIILTYFCLIEWQIWHKTTKIILININGADRPGVTAALTEILAKNNAVILDIGQADIHNHLSLGILFQSTEGNSGDILKELLFKSYELDVNIRFNPITEQEYSNVGMQGKNRYIITILSRKLTAKQIAGVSRIVAEQDMNIDDIKRLTGRIPLDENARTPKASVEFSVRGTPKNKECMKAEFMKLPRSLRWISLSKRIACIAVCAVWFVSIWTLPW